MAEVNPVQRQRLPSGVDCPASKSELLDAARSEGADRGAAGMLERLPDHDFNCPNNVGEAVGKLE